MKELNWLFWVIAVCFLILFGSAISGVLYALNIMVITGILAFNINQEVDLKSAWLRILIGIIISLLWPLSALAYLVLRLAAVFGNYRASLLVGNR